MCALETSTSGHAHHKPTPSAMWGRGVVREARATLGTWWFKEMINFNVKTVAVHRTGSPPSVATSCGSAR